MKKLLLVLLLAGCAPVKPWQRETLAHPLMQPKPDGLTAAGDEHMLDAREGSAGGSAQSGGGCGCN